jgi:hypothetical protein
MPAKRELSMGQLGHSLRLHCDGVGLRVDASIIRDYRRPSLSAKQSTPTPTIAASVRRIPGLLGDKLCGARAMRTEMRRVSPARDLRICWARRNFGRRGRRGREDSSSPASASERRTANC